MATVAGMTNHEVTVRGGNGAPEMVAPDGRTILGAGGAGETSGGMSSGTVPGGAGGGIYWDPANTHVISGPLSFSHG